ncbi:proprotein convertase P-domain-containing protein [Streptomyces spororaveus]|uniref:proprotein convertase P-domain-containing protein n=1 Tax=Streptomyces spororaveus TaxID=284039 RepID=UPI0037B5782B
MTWNMQGAGAGTESKWKVTVEVMAVGGRNYLAHDVIALQEAGPLGGLPAGTTVNSGTVTAPTTWTSRNRPAPNDRRNRPTSYYWETRSWQIGGFTRGRRVYITWVNTDPTGNRNNVAIVTHEQPRNVSLVFANRQTQNVRPGMRPAVGVELPDGSWFWSFHASSEGDRTTNDAENMVYQVAAQGGQWALLGDFNRNPTLINLPAGAQVYRSGQGTQHSSGGELDYMVSNDGQNMAGWTGRRVIGANSDHFGVEFAFQASAEQNSIMYEQDRECINAKWDDSLTLEPCDGIGEKFTLDNSFTDDVHRVHQTITAENGKCFDVRGGGNVPGAEVMLYACNGQENQDWWPQRNKEDLKITQGTGLCLDGRIGHENLEVGSCNTGVTSQRWIIFDDDPYFWDYRSPIGPATGTENPDDDDAAAGACSMPTHPLVDPCKHVSKRSTDDVAINDKTTVESIINVTDRMGFAPTNLVVGVDIKHPNRGDLTITLVGPSGRTYPLEDFTDTDTTDHVFRSYTVNASSETANGSWRLRVSDNASGNTGIIDAWNLTFPDSSLVSEPTVPVGKYFENRTVTPIADLRSTASAPITVTGISGKAPVNLVVGTDIRHTHRGDLEIYLIGPSGKAYLLEDFDNAASGPTIPSVYGVNVSSETANGTWKLGVNDFGAGDTGTINAWSLTFP